MYACITISMVLLNYVCFTVAVIFKGGTLLPLEMILPPELGLNDKLALCQQLYI